MYRGNPADAQTLEAAIGGAQDIGMNVASVFADRGYGDAVGDTALAVRGITEGVIPRKGKAHSKQTPEHGDGDIDGEPARKGGSVL